MQAANKALAFDLVVKINVSSCLQLTGENHMPVTTYTSATDLPMNKQAADLIFQIKLNDLHIIALQCVDLIMLTNLLHIYAT